tara:strand:+ start:427 stop:1110 length:684 start_codon:yes stop_codon:yes gene_type:complete
MNIHISLPLNIEVPNSPAEFKLGLMFRENLEEDSGMLFIFDSVEQQSFHMKDTQIPLDIAFIKEDGTIDSIKELKPHNLIPVYSDGEIQYALEVNKGWFEENNVNVGDKILEQVVDNYNTSDWRDDFNPTKIESVDIIKPEPMVSPKSNVPYEDLSETTRIAPKVGNIIDVYLAWRGSNYMLKTFFPQVTTPSRKEIRDQVHKVYPGAKIWNYQVSTYKPGDPLLMN